MTSAAVVLVIVIATHNVDDQATEAMRVTAAEALGSEDAVMVREVEVPSDAEALQIERSVRSQTVAEVVWLDDARTRARVRVHVGESNRWTERTIAFSSVDTPTERGRALGFAVTSMLPEEALAANPHRRSERGAIGLDAPGGEVGAAIRLSATGSTGVGGGIGGGVAGEFFVTPSVLLRLSFALRQATLGLKADPNGTTSSVTDLVLGAGAGVGFWPLRAGPSNRITAGLRLDVLAIYHGVTREPRMGDAMDIPVLAPGVDALAEVGWNVLGSFDIVTSLGIEVTLSHQDVFLNDSDSGRLSSVRGVAEVGFRLSF